MRRLPKFVRILGLKVEVIKAPELIHTDDHGHEQSAFGEFDHWSPAIAIDTTAGTERQKATLVHEVLHAAINLGEVGSVTTEEELVTKLAPLLHDFIRNNRAAVAYLQES